MELRSCSHFHYIHAIQGGLTKKVLNINTSGRPAVTFKKVIDIYGIIDNMTHKSFPPARSKDEPVDTILDGCKFKVKNPQSLYAERKLVKEEPEVSDNDSGSDSDAKNNDGEVDTLTLKQIMERCKKRKLRLSKSIDSSKENARKYSRQEPNQLLLSDEDDNDFNMALSLWKSKHSKHKKVKTKYEESRSSTITQCVQIIGKSDSINSSKDRQGTSDLPIPVVLKVEIPEMDAAGIQNTSDIGDLSPLYETVNVCLSAEPVGADLSLGVGSAPSLKKPQHHVLSSCDKYLEDDAPKLFETLCTEVINRDNLDTLDPLCSHSPTSETEAQYTIDGITKNSVSKTLPPIEEQCSDSYISQGYSITHEATCQSSSETLTCLNGITSQDEFRLSVISHGAEVGLTENDYTNDAKVCLSANDFKDGTEACLIDSKDLLTLNHETSVSTETTSECSLNTDYVLLSVDESPVKEKQSQKSEHSDADRNISPGFHLDNTADGFNQLHDSKIQRPPTRLLSTRTTISPTSQERLAKAMESMQLRDNECLTRYGNPYLKQSEYNVATAEDCDQMKRVEFDTNREVNFRKSKKRGHNSTGTTKVPHAGMRSSGNQNCSDNVIAFTQRQMQDIENVASKLTNQLKSMKAIIEDRLHVEGNKALNFKFNIDEVRTAIAEANKVESSAKKWLSMMMRDCNRFCKIMKTTENGLNTSENVNLCNNHKVVKKKIKFADEAGGKLCQVRLIEDDDVSFIEPQPNTEKYELVK